MYTGLSLVFYSVYLLDDHWSFVLYDVIFFKGTLKSLIFSLYPIFISAAVSDSASPEEELSLSSSWTRLEFIGTSDWWLSDEFILILDESFLYQTGQFLLCSPNKLSRYKTDKSIADPKPPTLLLFNGHITCRPLI